MRYLRTIRSPCSVFTLKGGSAKRAQSYECDPQISSVPSQLMPQRIHFGRRARIPAQMRTKVTSRQNTANRVELHNASWRSVERREKSQAGRITANRAEIHCRTGDDIEAAGASEVCEAPNDEPVDVLLEPHLHTEGESRLEASSHHRSSRSRERLPICNFS